MPQVSNMTQCPFCSAAIRPHARFCSRCGRPQPEAHFPLADEPQVSDPPPEVALRNARSIHIQDDKIDLRELQDVVESSVDYWQASLASSDAMTRERAAASIDQLQAILQSLSKQVAQGRSTVRITTRLPPMRSYPLICPACGHGNRENARYCLFCRVPLSPVEQPLAKEAPMSLRFHVAASTDRGRVRSINQDAVFFSKLPVKTAANALLALVADGMGGHSAGEEASRIASETSRTLIVRDAASMTATDDQAWQELLRQATVAANRAVFETAKANREQHGMGTTLTIALLVGERLHLASVGDTRAYMLNPQGVTQDGLTIEQLSSDHSLVARLVDIGQIRPEEARNHPQRNILYRTIGTDPSVEVDTRSEALEPGDTIVLCSDGLFNYVDGPELARIIFSMTDLEQVCKQLIGLANQRGGRDNISVVIIRVDTGSEARA